MTIDAAEVGRQLRVVSPQRWWMSSAALLAAIAATVATGVAAGGQSVFAIVLVVALAGVAVVRPATHSALGVFVAVVWYWLAAIDDPATPWAFAVASALFVFHALIALLAAAGPAATIDSVTLRRWLGRSIAVVGATAATWLAVAAFERQSSPGSAWLTALALVAVLALIAALRSVLPSPDERQSDPSPRR